MNLAMLKTFENLTFFRVYLVVENNHYLVTLRYPGNTAMSGKRHLTSFIRLIDVTLTLKRREILSANHHLTRS